MEKSASSSQLDSITTSDFPSPGLALRTGRRMSPGTAGIVVPPETPSRGASSMSVKPLSAAGLCLALLLLSNTGCFWLANYGPTLGPLAIPIPVSPYFQDKEEVKFWNHERYSKTPILGPIAPGQPCVAVDTPSDDEVMQDVEKVRPTRGGVPAALGTLAGQRADRERQDRRLHRPAARDAAGRSGAAAPCPLQVYRLLRCRNHLASAGRSPTRL